MNPHKQTKHNDNERCKILSLPPTHCPKCNSTNIATADRELKDSTLRACSSVCIFLLSCFSTWFLLNLISFSFGFLNLFSWTPLFYICFLLILFFVTQKLIKRSENMSPLWAECKNCKTILQKFKIKDLL